jgi:hypothetical protein
MTDTTRGTDVDLLRKAIAKLTTERENESRNRYRRAATPLLTERPVRHDAPLGSPGASTNAAQPPSTVDAVRAALLQLESLYNDGLVTIEEYQRKRVEILDRL